MAEDELPVETAIVDHAEGHPGGVEVGDAADAVVEPAGQQDGRVGGAQHVVLVAGEDAQQVAGVLGEGAGVTFDAA